MARTGISIKVSNTVLGSTPRVDSNSMLIVTGATSVSSGTVAFSLDTPYLLYGADDLDTLGITEDNNKDVYNQVRDYYSRNAGSILWLVGADTEAQAVANIKNYVRATVINGFQYRPRQIGLSSDPLTSSETLQIDLQAEIDALYTEGFSTVAIVGASIEDNLSASSTGAPTLATKKAGMVGTVIITNRQEDRPCVGFTLGYMASLSVGTSIGDVSLPSLGDSLFFCNTEKGGAFLNTPCAKISLGVANDLGDKQYIFARTRPPRNGLWFNDGATAEEAITALSTLEAARTIASMVDELRLFLTPYLNNKIPVNRDGDIQSTYRQVVLDNARSSVIVPYIQSGDISDAVINLRAQNDDMIGTRTWEVTLSIQAAPTLRWVDAFAFYVKSLN